VAKRRESLRVQPRTTAKIEDALGLALQHRAVHPRDVLLDQLDASTGAVVRLRQMLAQHPLAEQGVFPR
jgi:hypothetical protein